MWRTLRRRTCMAVGATHPANLRDGLCNGVLLGLAHRCLRERQRPAVRVHANGLQLNLDGLPAAWMLKGFAAAGTSEVAPHRRAMLYGSSPRSVACGALGSSTSNTAQPKCIQRSLHERPSAASLQERTVTAHLRPGSRLAHFLQLSSSTGRPRAQEKSSATYEYQPLGTCGTFEGNSKIDTSLRRNSEQGHC